MPTTQIPGTIDSTRFWLVIVAISAGLIAAITAAFVLLRIKEIAIKSGGNEAGTRGHFPNLARICLVFCLVYTAGVLATAGQLNEGILTFLSLIAGYVLGSGIDKRRNAVVAKADKISN